MKGTKAGQEKSKTSQSKTKIDQPNTNQEKAKTNQTKGKKRTAEEWVAIARNFGEECVKIQTDSKLHIDQKLEKQRVLGEKMAKEIQADSHLSEDDKDQMIDSINSYMEEWKALHDSIRQQGLVEEKPAEEKAAKKKKS